MPSNGLKITKNGKGQGTIRQRKGIVHNECTVNWLYIKGQGRQRGEGSSKNTYLKKVQPNKIRTSTQNKQETNV